MQTHFENILNIIDHYKGSHTKCSLLSRCLVDHPYIPSKVAITSEVAVASLRTYLQKTAIYKDAESYRYCMDTHYVESFNNALLQYHDKRIVFGDLTYKV